MRFGFIIVMLITGLFQVEAGRSSMAESPNQTTDALQPFLATTQASINHAAWADFVAKLSRKRAGSKNETQFLRYAFNRIHHQFLKRFAANTTFASLFDDGTYNCLTGTILYSILLNHFEIDHQVIETNYHIFILVQTQEEEVLIEITDPQDGFVTSADKLTKRIEQYRQQGIQPADPALFYYQYNFDLYNIVSQHELIGLLYYNLAVDSFNQKDLQKAVHYLGRAIERYASPRIEEFSEILLVAVHESNLKEREKILCKKELQTIRYKALLVMAGI